MLGILGALAFGVIATGSWISASNVESKAREYSRKNGLEFYDDKTGHLRYTQSGKKYQGNDDNIMLIASRWRMYNGYVEIYRKGSLEPKGLIEWLQEKYPNMWKDELYKMVKYKNEPWGDKYNML